MVTAEVMARSWLDPDRIRLPAFCNGQTTALRTYSGLMSPAAMIFTHFSISRSTWARNSAVDVPIGTAGQRIEAIGTTLPIVDGARTWSVVVPAGGTAELRYRYCWDRCQR